MSLIGNASIGRKAVVFSEGRRRPLPSRIGCSAGQGRIGPPLSPDPDNKILYRVGRENCGSGVDGVKL